MLTADTETRSLDWWLPDQVFMVQGYDGRQPWVITENDADWRREAALHISEHEMLTMANASFDIHMLRESRVADLLNSDHRLHDVQTLARVVLPGRWSYKLERLGDDLLGTDSTEQQRALKEAAKAHGIPWTQKDKDYYRLWQLEPELMERYGIEDVKLTYDLWQLVWSRATATDIEVYRMECEVAKLLRAAERDGVRVDQDALRVLKVRLEQERDDYHDKLLMELPEEALGRDADDEHERAAANQKALVAGLRAAGVPLYRQTPKSDPLNPTYAVNKDALREFQDRFPVVGNLLEWRSRKQTLSTYVGALEKARPNVHTSFNQVQARTSRMSASRPNVQNLPRTEGVRDVLVPAPGNAFVVCDYDSIEVRVLAHYLQQPELTRLLDEGMDFHTRTAAKVAGGKYEDYEKGGPNDEFRMTAKTTTFRTMYGGGANLTSVQLGIPIAEAAALIADILDAIPGYHDFNDQIKSRIRARNPAYVKTLLGRRLYVPKDKPYVGLNTVIQGTSADIMKLGMLAAAPVMAEFGYAIRLVVHDELVSEGPVDLAEDALPAIIKAMESAYPLSPRLKATGSFSDKSYGKAK